MKRLVFVGLVTLVACIAYGMFLIVQTTHASSRIGAIQEQLTGYTQIDTGFRNVEPGYYLHATCPGDPKSFDLSEVVVGGGATVGANQAAKVGRALVTSRPDGFHGWIAAYEGKPSQLRIVLICVKQFVPVENETQ